MYHAIRCNASFLAITNIKCRNAKTWNLDDSTGRIAQDRFHIFECGEIASLPQWRNEHASILILIHILLNTPDDNLRVCVWIGIGEDDVVIPVIVQCVQQVRHLIFWGHIGECHWMIGAKETFIGQSEIQTLLYLFFCHEGCLHHILHAKSTNVEYSFRLFS